MKVPAAALTLLLAPSGVAGQTCSGVSGPFTLDDVTGACTYETLLYEYTRQVFDAAGSTCAAGSTVTAQQDFDAKLIGATGAADAQAAARAVCEAMYDEADVTPYTRAADKGDDYHFEQMFYNGRTDWQEEIETLYETDDYTKTSVLNKDARKVRDFYRGEGSYSRVEWPNMLTNFDDATCASKAAMCCWPKDRQANDGNGNCATPYDEKCVDNDPADNTNLCFADFEKGNQSTGFDSAKGWAAFPGDNGNGEGAIHCHGFAWADDDYDSISRYKANNLFFVSMYDHMHQRGYVENIPGMPMCGCMEQMPIATRSDCTQVDLTEDWSMTYDGSNFKGHMHKVEIDFNACRGRNGRNNDLWAYAARLYDEGRMTRHQFGAVGRVLTDDHDCYHAVENQKAQKGYLVGYAHEEDTWTKVAGRDEMKTGEPYGRNAFNKAMAYGNVDGHGIVLRICPDCTYTHRKVYYKRITPIPEGFDLLHHILYYRSSNSHPSNKWGTDFHLYSSYDDAVNNNKPWSCKSDAFNYKAPFYGECSPDGRRVHDQYTVFNWYPGPRPNVAYYVDKPENEGPTDFIDNGGATRTIGMTDIDIGETGKEGNTMEEDGVYHITGAGDDIWGHRDEFHYLSQPWEGAIDVRVHLKEFANTGGEEWAKAGIMLRSDNSDDAVMAFALVSGSNGYASHWRRSKGAHADWPGKSVGGIESSWLRLLKKEQTVEFYYSATGAEGSWVLDRTETLFFPNDQYRVGLAVTSHRSDMLSEAVFENYEIAEYVFPTAAPSTSSAPTPWMPRVDIGEHSRAGEWSESNGRMYASGSGDGIWGSADDFFFYNEQVANTDTLTVMARIHKFHAWSLPYGRGGLMIRDSNDEDAANAFAGAAGNYQGASFQSRSATGGDTVHHRVIFTNWDMAHYAKLEKDGSVVTAYYKKAPEDDWTLLGSTEVTFTGPTLQVGLAVTPGVEGGWATLEYTDYGAFVPAPAA